MRISDWSSDVCSSDLFGSLILWHHDVALVMTLLVIQSIGLGVVSVTLQIVIVSAAPAARVSEATGMMTVIRATALAIGAQTVETLLSRTGQHGSGVAGFPAAHRSVACGERRCTAV